MWPYCLSEQPSDLFELFDVDGLLISDAAGIGYGSMRREGQPRLACQAEPLAEAENVRKSWRVLASSNRLDLNPGLLYQVEQREVKTCGKIAGLTRQNYLGLRLRRARGRGALRHLFM